MSSRGNVLVLVVIIVAAILAVIGAYLLGVGSQKQIPSPQLVISITPQITTTPTQSIGPTGIQESKTGIIEGSLSYPSEGIPKNLTVCAQNSQSEEVTCTDKQIKDPKYTYGVGFILEVSVGTYLVYAILPGNEYRAYYSEFVTCGLSVNCPSHKPIEVKVNPSQTTGGVDPHDWYNQ